MYLKDGDCEIEIESKISDLVISEIKSKNKELDLTMDYIQDFGGGSFVVHIYSNSSSGYGGIYIVNVFTKEIKEVFSKNNSDAMIFLDEGSVTEFYNNKYILYSYTFPGYGCWGDDCPSLDTVTDKMCAQGDTDFGTFLYEMPVNGGKSRIITVESQDLCD